MKIKTCTKTIIFLFFFVSIRNKLDYAIPEFERKVKQKKMFIA